MCDNEVLSFQYPPVIERAHTRKQAAAEAEGLRWQLEKKENEMNELKKVIKARIDDVSNYKVGNDLSVCGGEGGGGMEGGK